MNKVLLIGRVARDVEVKTTQNGRDYSFNAIACKRDYKNKDGKYDSDFVPVTFGDVPCKFLKEYVDKGDLVEVIGRWQTRKDKDGNTTNECIVENLTLIEKKKVENELPKSADERLGNNPSLDDISKDLNEVPEDELPF